MSCPWAKIETPEPVNLIEIISEEVARELQAKEEKKIKQFQEACAPSEQYEADIKTSVDIPSEILKAVSDNTSDNDQVQSSFDDYQTILDDISDYDEEEEEIDDINIGKDWDKLDTLEYQFASDPSFYKIQKDGKIVTTHMMSGAKKDSKSYCNLSKLQLVDRKKFDLKLFNELFKSEQIRRFKFLVREEDQVLSEFGLDKFTRFLLYKMICNRLLERINDVVSIGKEAIVLHADLNPSYPLDPQFPKECVIKIFRMTNPEIKQIDEYIKKNKSSNEIGTPSVQKAIHSWVEFEKRQRWLWPRENKIIYLHNSTEKRIDTRKTISNLAEKEMDILMKLQKAQVPCPKVITFKMHVLVTSFIGENHTPAPLLRTTDLSMENYIFAYNQIIEGMKTMFKKLNLIHVDLMDNVLWHNGQCYFVDFSQSVEHKNQHSLELLFDSCRQVTYYFTKKFIPDLKSEYDLFEYVTGVDFRDKLVCSELEESSKRQSDLVDKPEIE